MALAIMAALLMNNGPFILPVAHADTAAQTLPFTQNWSDASLITVDDNWNTVPGIIGYRGDDAAAGTGVDPQTVTQDLSGVIDVNANHNDPNTFTTGGVTEFDGIANPVVALQGSGTADFPNLVITLNTTGQSNVNVAYNLRDIDGSADNATQAVALQFRVGNSGAYTNVPAGFVADATTGPSQATLVTPVNVTLPPAADNQSVVQVRIITTNAVGSDEWVGIDDINITGGGTGTNNPSGVGSANPSTVAPGNSTLLTVTVTPGSNPPSTGLAVTANLTSIGGSATQQLFDDGAHEDGAAGDNVFAFRATVTSGTTQGGKSLPVTITDAQARTASANISLTVQSAAGLAIHDVQGSGSTSPFANQSVTVAGIVTALRFNSTNSAVNGFFLQTPDANADADPNTSEGIFVFSSSAPPASVVVGNLITVTGTVSEFIPSSDLHSPPETELVGPLTISVTSTGNPLPAAITLTAADTSPTGSIEQLEKFEGMRVRVNSLTATAPTQGIIDEANATSTTNGTFYGVITGIARPFREPGIEVPDPVPTPSPSGTPPPNVPRFDANPERLRVDSDAQPGSTALELSTGAVVTNLVGPLDYVFRTYTILPDPTPVAGVSGGFAGAVPVPTPTASEFAVGSFNMQRFYDTVDDAGTSDVVLTATAFNNRLNKASLAIRNVMRTPDIIGVEEMENLTTLQAVANKVNNDAVAASQPNPNYQAFLSEGNDIGGIDVGFLVKTARVNVIDVTQLGKTTTFVQPDGTTALLNDRPPLVLRATINKPAGGTEAITVIVNHLRSLTGVDDPVDGARIRAKRKAQAEFLANLIQSRQTADPTERILSVGDYNAFQFNDGYVDSIGTIKGTPTPPDQVVLASSDLVNPNLTDLIDLLPADQRYTFTFDGNAQTLDHELVNSALLPLFSRISIARNNGDFQGALRNDSNRPERVSDHDMPVAYFNFTGTVSGLRQKAHADFDGDMKTDLSIIRPSGFFLPPISPSGGDFPRGMDWFIKNSQSNTTTVKSWGIFNADVAVPADFDGDGKTDIAVWRRNEGNWYILQSQTNTGRVEEIGLPNDVPVPADYDGDGKADVAVWRQDTGGWIIRESSHGGSFRPQVFWGEAALGDLAVPGDYDGDGKTDIAVWRQGEGNWYVINSQTNTVSVQGWGQSGDKPVQSDYDGDGKTDIAVFRPSDGNWYIRNSGGGVTVRNWGLSTDTLVPGDYDGDGKTDIAVFREGEGNWYIINSQTNTVSVQTWGQSGDLALPSTYIPH
ncbi:MAG TPA: FG-GAP-like repeat-containing protein [Pyrinomonadaceae bacterium]